MAILCRMIFFSAPSSLGLPEKKRCPPRIRRVLPEEPPPPALPAAPEAAPADRDDIRKECQYQLDVYKEFAPAEMSEEEIRKLVQSVLDQLEITAPTMRDKGPVMKHLMPQVKGKADGKLVNKIVGEMLQG